MSGAALLDHVSALSDPRQSGNVPGFMTASSRLARWKAAAIARASN